MFKRKTGKTHIKPSKPLSQPFIYSDKKKKSFIEEYGMKSLWIILIVVLLFCLISFISTLITSKDNDDHGLPINIIKDGKSGTTIKSKIDLQKRDEIITGFKVKYRIYNNDNCDDTNMDEYVEIIMV